MMKSFVTTSPVWNVDRTPEVLRLALDETQLVHTRNGESIYNVPASFDIETTSFYLDELGNQIDYAEKMRRKATDDTYNPEKVSVMYIWQLGINGQVIIGRTWEQFITCLSIISSQLELNHNKRLIIYVHNLAYEFQFMRKWLKWEKVFSIDERKPIYAISELGIEFRCSYLLSGYSLENLSKQLMKYPVSKMIGDLDYSLIRNSATKLTERELGYCINDVRVVMAFIQEEIERNGNITKIPLTKTGYVRNFCRARTLRHKGSNNTNRAYRKLMGELKINDSIEFDMLQRAFQGGFTHANARYSGEVCYNVSSYDFTSSYPTVMLAEKFPMSRGKQVHPKNMKTFLQLIENYCCVFDCKFTHLEPRVLWENPISISKCWEHDRAVTNNGRVVIAEKIGTTITDVDFKVIQAFYRWEHFEIGTMYIYKRGYLPKELIDCILDLYENKTTLKGVEGREVDYMQSKAMINAVYGMCVTNILRDEHIYQDGEWSTETPEGEEKETKLFKNNESKQRFLFYPWGVFVTAYARRNLFTGILAMGWDYIYSDTDSIKCFNHEKHADYFKWYNERIIGKLESMADYYGIDHSRFKPKTIKGVEKPLGVWDYEGTYTRFKTLGAKRYLVEEPNALRVGNEYYPISLTVSGVNKFTAVPYLLEEYGGTDGVFNAFEEYLDVPAGKAGKMLHMYIDDPKSGILVDYNGVAARYDERSSVHLENSGYNLSMASMYLAYMAKVKTVVL